MKVSLAPRLRPQRRGLTLVEVLAAIFIMGIGLLALLVLFPLGALEMAQAIKDDRAAQAAAAAVDLSERGKEVLSRTRDFVLASAASGTADPKLVAALQADYSDLSQRSAEVETQLRVVRPLAPNPRARLLVDRLLLQIRSIKLAIGTVQQLLQLLRGPIPTD